MKNLLIISISISISFALFTACGNSEPEKQVSKEQVEELLKSSRPCKPQTNDKDWYTTDTKAPLFEGLDGIDFKISTNNPEAQQYFNQVMMLSYGFNHAEAARSFY